MSINFGTGVSRVLDPSQTGFNTVIWQQGKPPLDAELNLIQQLSAEWNRINVLRGVPSGWLGNETSVDRDFITNPIWSNWFRFGNQRTGEKQAIQWAVVNGWLIPVTGTRTGTPPGSPNNTDTWNKVALDPPPANTGDARIDFVFLEAWLARVPPNPSTLNKPAAASIYRYGNVEGGYGFIADDLVDPAIGFETSQRVQVQYRIRVVSGLIGLATYPDGFDPALVKGQGSATAPTSFTFANMRQELDDPGLWRAGDGTANSLGTVDGYTYAVPLCVVFRRNAVAWDGDPSQNLNGAFNRNPTAIDRTGVKTFSTTPTLAANITSAALTLTLSSASNIPLPLTPATPVFVQIGDEIMSYSSITGTTMTLVARGAFGTLAERHFAGDTITVLSGRPDGLFSDQIARTDIMDLRHVVNPNGYDYDVLLKSNFDALLRGQLRANWKRSGGGPQGSFVFYQDKITAGSAALGVTKLDAPDNIRMVYSDAAMLQKVEVIVKPATAATPPGPPQAVAEAWSLSIQATGTVIGVANQWNGGDRIEIPISQFKVGFPGGDGDQVRFINDGLSGAVEIRIDGRRDILVEGTHFTVSPANPGPNDDLEIELLPAFPSPITEKLYITVHVQYGAGRGLSRKPDSLHSAAILSPTAELLTQLSGIPTNNVPMRVAWAPLWSKYRNTTFQGLLPVTASAYADLGSKSIFLTPFRRIDLPDTTRARDGSFINVNSGATVTSGTAGSSTGTTTFTDGSQNFTGNGVVAGQRLVIASGAAAGSYRVVTVAVTTLTVDRAIPTAAGISYTIHATQGLMPLNNLAGGAKWATTDPLNLFSGTLHGSAPQKDIYVSFPRHLIPGWGEVRVPILYANAPGGIFDRGINYMVRTEEGATPPNREKNYVPFSNGSLSYAPFSTLDLTPETPATFNAQFTFSGKTFAGIRQFTDTRGLGRQGLELPPFYGVARLFAVYEALDYKANGSAFGPTDRVPTGSGATNLLRQNFDGATFWVELDSDGDSTFILNAATIDIAKSPNPIVSFASGNYVVEASIFGFDRGTFDLSQEPRLVMTRERAANQANDGVTRDNNFLQRWDGTITAGTVANVDSPDLAVPGPLPGADSVVINFSRQPYQGDAWGSQTSNLDVGYTPGPLTTGTLFQLVSTALNESGLTRPNQKPVEVLASLNFCTTLGTGRLSGDVVDTTVLDFRNVGYEDPTAYPPPSGVAPRPRVLVGADTESPIGTEYLGCTSRLPLGATFRDKDFRGENIGVLQFPHILTGEQTGGIFLASQSVNNSLEQTEVNVSTSSIQSGTPGGIIVMVDGEQGNYSLLTNYRVNRGGSAFNAGGNHPGGEIATNNLGEFPVPQSLNLMSGIVMLVRNQVTSVGATEVSAGDELMMVIVTTGTRIATGNGKGFAVISTAGTGEGVSAADLYRIQGRPLVRDQDRMQIDPSTIALSRRLTLGDD